MCHTMIAMLLACPPAYLPARPAVFGRGAMSVVDCGRGRPG